MSFPDAPILVAGLRQAAWLSPDGEIDSLDLAEAAARAEHSPVIVCHAPEVAARLELKTLSRALDVLDLYAFTRPATFCLPTPGGLADALGLPLPGNDAEAQAETLMQATQVLLDQLAAPAYPDRPEAQRLARTMQSDGWPWGDVVVEVLGAPRGGEDAGSGLAVWNALPEWEDEAPPPPPDDLPVGEEEAQERLRLLLGAGSEDRAPQRLYAQQVSAAFKPRPMPDVPNAVMAEAGTGVGKTLGYLAPATLWAEKNKGPVWLSTYTKNLQRQIDQELDRYFPDRTEKSNRVVLRKGRENYLCLLNLEEAIGRAGLVPENRIRLALIARWARYTRDGDMNSGDLPAWLLQRIGPGRASGLTDRRGECVYSACTHWRRCFIERNIRKAKHAELVIANHALVMIHAALYGQGDDAPTRYVFDEGHHLFDAADSAFSSFLSGQEMAELRRWVRGGEGNRRDRSRDRVSDRGTCRHGTRCRRCRADAFTRVEPFSRHVNRRLPVAPRP
ncbi:MAG: ATP-dependent DNA helicase, partial [Alphaproteobacteria bacterium]|nr:ATP-dependent DNA helicase [Alphaproteobacteria bacterium]